MMASKLQRAAATASAPMNPMKLETAIKIAVAMALLRSKSYRKPHLHPSSSESDITFRVQHWKRKAKERKQEILRLKDHLKDLEDATNSVLYSQSPACECYFFHDLGKVNSRYFVDGSDCELSDVLRRRFLRQGLVRLLSALFSSFSPFYIFFLRDLLVAVRVAERKKRRLNDPFQPSLFSESSGEDELEMLKLSVDFLVDLCCTPCLMEKESFSNLAHQAVKCIHVSVNSILSTRKNIELIEETINNLVTPMVKRMSAPAIDVSESGRELDVQHIIRKLGNASAIGQRVMLCVTKKISEVAENLLFLDPFDSSFPDLHDSMLVMIQLIEFIVSDYLGSWTEEEYFDMSLFEHWVASFHRARQSLELLESRTTLYVVYMDRVAGEFARQAGQTSNLLKLNPDIVHSLFK